MGHIEGSAFPGTFEHIASGYAAGYYGYMWAEVIGLDLLSAFDKNMLDPHWREIGISAVHAPQAPGVYRGLAVTIVTTDFGVRR